MWIFQARRMGAKYKTENGNEFVGTLKWIWFSCWKTYDCFIENNQNEDGSVNIPNVLKKYMNNLDKI